MHFDSLSISDLRKTLPQEYDNVIILNEPEEDSGKIDSSTTTIPLLIKSLFSEVGSEIYLKPVDYYLSAQDGKASFLELMELAEQRGEILLGYRKESDRNNVDRALGVTINPSKHMTVAPEKGDCLIALAEDELYHAAGVLRRTCSC
ncbi:MAG: hypothetical protein JW874_11375 [Spirochaetales bacterium]|nr:hypothetical protein [Spirochaetales bacterium]